MEENLLNLNNKIYSSNNILLEIIADLNQLRNSTNNNSMIKRLSESINKINYIINENTKNLELLQRNLTELIKKLSQYKTPKENVSEINQQITYNDGSKYIGPIINGLKEGKGICYWNNGDKYDGEWKNDKREGEGIYYYNREPFTGDKYVGYWKNNKREGKAIYYFNNGNRYEGDWKDDKIEGKGIFYWNSGNKYEGEWKNYKQEGNGIFEYKNEPFNGDRYEGGWRNGKKEGKGIYYFNNGDRRMGDFCNGEPVGKHVTLTKDGDVKTEYFSLKL